MFMPSCLLLKVSVCVLQDVYDKVEYLSSLGKTQTAAVQRDADIGVAEAERDAGIRVRWHRCVPRSFIHHNMNCEWSQLTITSERR